jgi:hypothetical protein
MGNYLSMQVLRWLNIATVFLKPFHTTAFLDVVSAYLSMWLHHLNMVSLETTVCFNISD